MLSTALWVTALALESALLLRAFRGKLPKNITAFSISIWAGSWFSDLALIPFYYLLAQNLRIRLLE